MNLNEVASLLGMSKERALLVIEQGIETPKMKLRVRLRAIRLQHGYDVAQEDLDGFFDAFDAEEPGRHPPVAVRRMLLIEAGYKCAVCRDSAPIEFHHIIEWTTLSHHDPEHMLAICANCHGKITRYGEPDVHAQRQIKKNLQDRRAANPPTPEFLDLSHPPSFSELRSAAPLSSNESLGTSAEFPTSNKQPDAAGRPVTEGTSPPRKSFERCMRQIFVSEVTYAGPSRDELQWVGALLFSERSRSDIPDDCILLLRTARAIFQLQRITNPDAAWTDWAYSHRIIEATANVFAELDFDLSTVNQNAEKALESARSYRYLQFKSQDEWSPGMASGTGWVEYASLSLIGEKILKKTDTTESNLHSGD
jgi:hypothetical protein